MKNPKEEPKQIYYNTVGRENGEFVIKGQFNTQKEALDLANELNEKGLGVYYDWKETLIKEKSKQETLEEFIQRQLSLGKYQDQESAIKYSIELGAKWQQERSYSEEEVKNLLNKRLLSIGIVSSNEATNIWFKQFKK